MSVKLDLIVHSTHVVDLPARSQTSQVAGSVDSITVEVVELFGREFWTLQIAQRHTITTDQQLAWRFGRTKLALFVNNIDLRIGYRHANPDWIGVVDDLGSG